MVVDFDDLQRLSGYKQASKVIEWLREQRVAYVVGGDGKPRTTHDMLRTFSMARQRRSYPHTFRLISMGTG